MVSWSHLPARSPENVIALLWLNFFTCKKKNNYGSHRLNVRREAGNIHRVPDTQKHSLAVAFPISGSLPTGTLPYWPAMPIQYRVSCLRDWVPPVSAPCNWADLIPKPTPPRPSHSLLKDTIDYTALDMKHLIQKSFAEHLLCAKHYIG